MTTITTPTIPTAHGAFPAFGGLKLSRVVGWYLNAPLITRTSVQPSMEFVRRETDGATPDARLSTGTLDANNGAALLAALDSLVKAGLPAKAPGPLPTDTPHYTLEFLWKGTEHKLDSSHPSAEFHAVISALDAGVAASTRAASR